MTSGGSSAFGLIKKSSTVLAAPSDFRPIQGQSTIARRMIRRLRIAQFVTHVHQCGNVSILLPAGGTARQHELAVRTAVRAGRFRTIRQLLAESLLLVAIGALLGVLTSLSVAAQNKP